eukprot:Skav226973  [mRNA]  locus=scaffold51:396466:397035:- [translate_table: standard]
MLDPSSDTEVPGRYVSSFGRITSQHGHISWGYLEPSGYYVTGVRKRPVRVHRLVAFAFLGPPPSQTKYLVNHKDLDKKNNGVDNLEYVTPAENMTHFHSNAVVTRTAGLKPVLSRPHGSDRCWTWHASSRSAARKLAVDQSNVSKCLSGQRKQAGGYEFRLAEAPESLPGEVWREVDIPTLLQIRERRN